MSVNQKSTQDIVLFNQQGYHQWYDDVRGSVASHLWPYFDPESEAVYPVPVAPVPPASSTIADSTISTGISTEAESSTAASSQTVPGTQGTSARAASISLATEATLFSRRPKPYKEDMEYYFKLHTIYRDDLKQWEKFNEAEARLRDKIRKTVAPEKLAPLSASRPVREWLKDLKASTAPTRGTVRQNIWIDYQRFMMNGLIDWPSGGPGNWLAKWEDLVYRAREFEEPLPNWLSDVSLVWQKVPDLMFEFKAIERDIRNEEVGDYTKAQISAIIQQAWERRKQGLALRYTKPRSTRSAFAAVTFEGQEAPEFEEEGEEAADSELLPLESTRKRKHQATPRTRSKSPTAQNDRTTHQNRDPCEACGGNHLYRACYLVLGISRSFISTKAKKTFEDKMKDAQFKKRVEEFRRLANPQQSQ